MYDYYDEDTRIATVAARFEEKKHLRLPPNSAHHSHGKEYHFSLNWSTDGQKFINYKLDYYNGKLYYLDLGYLFECAEDGSNPKVLVKISDYFKTDIAVSVRASNVFLAVNGSGIYLYQHGQQLTVAWFSLDGALIKEIAIKEDASQVYVAEGLIYYVVTKSDSKQAICCMKAEDESVQVILEATRVLELYGSTEKAVMKVYYEKNKLGRLLSDEGWYEYSLQAEELLCLSSGNCPPHHVWEYPDEYMEGHPSYIDFKDKVRIRAVDLERNIMWIATPLKERLGNGITSQEYWEPMELTPEGAPITNAPIWRLTPPQFAPGTTEKQVNEASYFDGTCFLNGRSLYLTKSYDVEGHLEQYGISENRGSCHVFRVLHGHVYADFEGTGWEQYKIEDYKLTFVRACQIGLPNHGASSEIKALVKAYNKK